MEKIRGYANIFEINAIYLQITNELLK